MDIASSSEAPCAVHAEEHANGNKSGSTGEIPNANISTVTKMTSTIWPMYPTGTVTLAKTGENTVTGRLCRIIAKSVGGVAILAKDFVPPQFRPAQIVMLLGDGFTCNDTTAPGKGWFSFLPSGEIHIGCTSDGTTGFGEGDNVGFLNDLQFDYELNIATPPTPVDCLETVSC